MSVPQPRRYQLDALLAELAQAGINVPSLGYDESGVFGIDLNGNRFDLPTAAAPVIAAHDPSRRRLTDRQQAALQQFRAVKNATTFATMRGPLIALLWSLVKFAVDVTDADDTP